MNNQKIRIIINQGIGQGYFFSYYIGDIVNSCVTNYSHSKLINSFNNKPSAHRVAIDQAVKSNINRKF